MAFLAIRWVGLDGVVLSHAVGLGGVSRGGVGVYPIE